MKQVFLVYVPRIFSGMIMMAKTQRLTSYLGRRE